MRRLTSAANKVLRARFRQAVARWLVALTAWCLAVAGVVQAAPGASTPAPVVSAPPYKSDTPGKVSSEVSRTNLTNSLTYGRSLKRAGTAAYRRPVSPSSPMRWLAT